MTRFRWVLIGLGTSAIGACQLFGGLGGLEFKGKTSSGLAGGGGSGQGGHSGQGAGTLASGGAGPSTSTSSTTSSSVSSTSSGGTGLDPNLVLPDPAGMPCSDLGNENDCPNLEVCRIASKNGGRCEGCTECGNLNANCATGEDCDILFECYRGHCTNFCMLGTTECGAPQNCVDVGNASEGVCWPVN